MTPEEKRKRQQAANKNLGKNIPTEIVKECLELYRQGAPMGMIREKMGIEKVQLVFQNRGYKYPRLNERRRLIRQWRINQVDWSPIADIKPVLGMRGYAMFTAEEQRLIKQFMVDNYNNLTASDVDRFFKTPVGTVNTILRSPKPRTTRNLTRNLSDEDFRELHKRHMAGESITKLSRETGCAQATLSRRFKTMGLEIICHRLEPRKKAALQIRQMYADGKTTRDIAETLGVSIWVVREERKLLRKDIELAERKAERRGAAPVVSKRPHRKWMGRI